MANLISSVGLRVPRMVPVANPESFETDLAGLDLPILLRNIFGHGGEIFLIEQKSDCAAALSVLKAPIAVEFIDVRGADGLYRKYRYFMAGDEGISRHLFLSRRWEVRPSDKLETPAAREEEGTYLAQPNPHHELFNAARQALGYDIVAFDYSYDRSGNLVVWEANPFPDLEYSESPAYAYKRATMDATFGLMLKLYFRRAQLPLPNGIF